LIYESERRIQRYTRKSRTFYRLGFEGRSVLWHLEGEANLLGRVAVFEGDEQKDIAARLDVPAEVFRVGLEKCFEEDAVRWEPHDGPVTKGELAQRGVTKCEAGEFVIVDFVAAQRAGKSGALRAAEHRERQALIEKLRAREKAAASRSVTKLGTIEKVSVEDARRLGLLNRAAAAKVLGISRATLRRREGEALKPMLSELGEYLFRPEDVAAMAAKMREDLAPSPRPHREPPPDPLESPVWRERGRRLAECMGDGIYSTAEMYVLGRRVGLTEQLLGETLAACEGRELTKAAGKWSATKGENK